MKYQFTNHKPRRRALLVRITDEDYRTLRKVAKAEKVTPNLAAYVLLSAGLADYQRGGK